MKITGPTIWSGSEEAVMIATMQSEMGRRVTEMAEQPVIASLNRVSKKFEHTTALDGINLNIHAGELVALLGPNGAGKTTAVKLLLGLASPTAGRVSVFGGNPLNAEVRTRTGAMLQVAKVPETLRVREHIDLFSSYYPAPLSLRETLSIAKLEEIRDREFGELSGGQKQRVLFALALCGDPDLIFLDEPTVGMDVEARRLLWQQIRKLVDRGKTVLLTTHYLEEADALADRIVVINRGRIIAEGSPVEIKSRTSGQKIRCRSDLTIDVLQSLPGVLEASKSGPWVEIRATAAESVLRELLLRDAAVNGIEVTSAGLEEAFLALTTTDTEKN
jgi:ABC-2 type transport system ATP-binding protein